MMIFEPEIPLLPGWRAGLAAIVALAPAKVNLFLEVTGKRADGFHDIETLMVAVDLFDTLEIEDDPTGTLTLECFPPGLPTGPGNLVYEAAAALQTAVAPGRGAKIRLTKRIPHEAGLGGGSSDAATTLLALNAVWKLGTDRAALTALAATLGSDVAFFMTPPAGWCVGRGEHVTPAALGTGLDFVIVKPPVGCSTAEVYRRVAVPAAPADGTPLREALRIGDKAAIARNLHNRLQEPACAVAPRVAEVIERMEWFAPRGVLMSGSGSAVFALCGDRSAAIRLADAYRTRDAASLVFVVRSWPSVT